MLQSQVSTPSVPAPDRRSLAPNRPTPPALVANLVDAGEFQRLAERQIARCKRDGQPLSVLSLQVVFDAEPDAALRQQLLAEWARRLCSRVRSTDCVARWQDTHFGVLLVRCEAVNAEAVLARLARAGSGNYRVGDQLLNLRLQGQVFSGAAS